ncbi:MAG: hypothetical protein ACE5H9_04470 [Anaerolineae bacterium]
MENVRSKLVVISWWSNCLGLTCLRQLAKHTRQRDIYVVQVGKTQRQKERFRAYMPPSVKELPYAQEAAAEHCRVIEAVSYRLLVDQAGLWFIDHDTFVYEDCQPWLNRMDRVFSCSNLCLCHPRPSNGPAITNPAFWLSPRRLPPDLPSLAVIPYRQTRAAKRPYAIRRRAELIMPEKDTLVLAKEFLAARGMACDFPLKGNGLWAAAPARSMPPFPRHQHLSGLYLLAGPVLPEQFFQWMRECVQRFTLFYETCPHAWLAAEDPVLLRRLREFQKAVGISPGRRLKEIEDG